MTAAPVYSRQTRRARARQSDWLRRERFERRFIEPLAMATTLAGCTQCCPGASLTITARGTGTATFLTNFTLSSVTCNTDDLLVVSIAKSNGTNDIGTVKWNSVSLTLGANSVAGTAPRALIYFLNVSAGATASLVITSSAGTGRISVTATTVAGLASNAVDKSATNTGSGTTPNSGLTATTTVALEYIAGAVATLGPNTDSLGTWGGGFAAAQAIGSNTGSNDVECSEGNATQAATQAWNAQKTAITSRSWAVACQTFK